MYLIEFEYCIADDTLLSDRTVTYVAQHSLATIELCISAEIIHKHFLY